MIYIKVIEDLCCVLTIVRSFSSITSVFPVTTSLHQGPILSPYIFALIMNEFPAII